MVQKKILLVDDDEEIRNLMEQQIQSGISDSVEIVSVTDGIKASQLLDANNYDMILTDLQMPRKTGEDFMRIARYSKKNEFIPTLVVTGFPNKELLEQYPPLIMLEKPLEGGRLVAKIKECFQLPRDVYQSLARLSSLILDGVLFFTGSKKI